jgi:hypothetical protein
LFEILHHLNFLALFLGELAAPPIICTVGHALPTSTSLSFEARNVLVQWYYGVDDHKSYLLHRIQTEQGTSHYRQPCVSKSTIFCLLGAQQFKKA